MEFDLDQLKIDLQDILKVTEGRQLSETNKTLVQQIADSLDNTEIDDESYRPLVEEVQELCSQLLERDFSTDRRQELAKSGAAKPDGSYPIVTVEDLKNAIRAWGRGGATESDKQHIIKRARALGATKLLPEGWGGGDGDNTKEAVGYSPNLGFMPSIGVSGGYEAHNYTPGHHPNQYIHGHGGEGLHTHDIKDQGDLNHAISNLYGHEGIHPGIIEHLKNAASKIKGKLPTFAPASYAVAGYGPIPPTAMRMGSTDDADSEYVPPSIRESASDVHIGEIVSGVILEQTDPEKKGREWEVMLIQAGTSANKFHYSPDTLKDAVGRKIFEGKPCFADHSDENPLKRSVRDKVGKYVNTRYDSVQVKGKQVEGVVGTLKVIAPWVQQTLLESVEQGEPDFLGFSIDGDGRWESKIHENQKVKWVNTLASIRSIDLVHEPSAGGRLTKLVASKGSNMEDDNDTESTMTITKTDLQAMLADAIKEATKPTQDLQVELTALRESARKSTQYSTLNVAIAAASGLSDLGQQRIRESFSEAIERRDLSQEEIDARIQEQVDYEAALLGRFMPVPSAAAKVYLGDAQHEKMFKALQGMFEGEDIDGIPQFRTLKEAYCRWTNKDYFDVDPWEMQADFSGKYDSGIHHKKIQESLNTAQWNQVYADVFYLMMMKTYRTSPVYNLWRQVVSEVENAPDFQTRHWTRIGGYGDLTTVAESATYPLLTTPTDEEVTYAVQKRGGLDDVTFESIVNDRVGAVRRIPIAMGRAAARTLWKFVMNMITTDNPTMAYDSVALYNAAHNNLNTNQLLTITGMQLAVAAMRQQTAYSEVLEILGERNKPAVMIVPTALEYIAKRILDPSDAFATGLVAASVGSSADPDPQAFKGSGITPIVYDVLTDPSDWYLIANPREVETAIVGFFNGRQDPEMFVQDQPNVGSNFTADKQTYKVRHIYSGVVADHRSFYKNVAP